MTPLAADRAGLASQLMTALALSAGAAVALGFSRFAYALFLPAMRQDLSLSYFLSGAINTANGVGYILGAALTARIARRYGAARTFLGGYLISVLALLVTPAVSDFSWIFLVRTAGGVATAVTFICGAGLTSAIAPDMSSARRGSLLSIYVGGASLGMVLAGLLAPRLLADDVSLWRLGWVQLGMAGALAFPGVFWALRQIPPALTPGPAGSVGSMGGIWPTAAGYAVFGAGYAAYMTFILALLKEIGASERAGALWLALAVSSALSSLIWGRLFALFPVPLGPTLVYLCCVLGALPVLIFPSTAGALVSVILFGASFMASTTGVTLVAQRYMDARQWTWAIAQLTTWFAIGLTVGPILAGAISDLFSSVALGFWSAPLMMLLAAACGALQMRRLPAPR